MERNLINFCLVVCITLGFVSLFGVYLPERLSRSKTVQTVMGTYSENPTLADIIGEKKGIAPLSLKKGKSLEDYQQEFQIWIETQEGSPEEPAETFEQPRIMLDAAEEALKYSIQPYRPLPLASLYVSGFYFRTPYEIREMVEFWRNVFAKYNKQHALLHDQEHLGIIYGVLDFSDLYEHPDIDDQEVWRVRRLIEEEKKEELRTLLLSFHDNEPPRTEYQRFVHDLFDNIGDPRKFKQAAENIRAQRGQKDKFEEGLVRFGRYREALEEIFREEGVPAEITRLTFVESMFNIDAVSKVAAKGPWQFMDYTGKEYMEVNDYTDERLDPLIAGRAAARLLKKNFEHVKNWPMAINGYNTGVGHLINAKKRLQTDNISAVIRYYKHPAYQFASRNFYPEFLAALEVSGNYRNYFGELPLEEPVPYDEIVLEHHTSVYKLADTLQVDLNILRDLNPSYLEQAYTPFGIVPSGSLLRIPKGQTNIYLSALDLLKMQEKNLRWHVVKNSDTLRNLAARFEVPEELLQYANGMLDKTLSEGQILKIPSLPGEVVLERESL